MVAARMTSRLLVRTCALAVMLLPAGGIAQDRPTQAAEADISPGARVRLPGPGTTWRVGTVVSATPDTLLVRWSRDDPLAMAVPRSAPLEVSRGRRGQARRGAKIGAVTGVVTGSVLGAVAFEPCEAMCIGPNSAPESAMAAGALLGIAGALAGGVIGAIMRTDVWHPIAPSPTSPGDDVPPGGQSVRIGLALRF